MALQRQDMKARLNEYKGNCLFKFSSGLAFTTCLCNASTLFFKELASELCGFGLCFLLVQCPKTTLLLHFLSLCCVLKPIKLRGIERLLRMKSLGDLPGIKLGRFLLRHLQHLSVEL